MNEPSFETTDWPLETKRVARAFGAVGKCELRIKNPIRLCYLIQGYLSEGGFEVTYVQTRIGFIIYGESDQISAQLGISWSGQVLDCYIQHYYPLPLARALFHLGFLTPEVEAKLQVSITAHEKLEWAREFEERLKYEIIDWDAEAKRIVRAFGIKRECRFKVTEISGELIVNKRLFRSNRMFDNKLVFQASYFKSGLSIERRAFRLFESLMLRPISKDAYVSISRDGVVRISQAHHLLSIPLAKGLFHIDLLTPEVEAALQVSITAHEKLEWKLEWKLEYEESYGE